jgi:LacI family transcriptional regulator
MGTGRRNNGGTRAPTIRDVARLAGVSIGTVSKALNESGRLRPETRNAIVQIANAIGYRANELAQSLHRSRSMTVGIISNDSFGRFTLPIVEALEEQLAERGIAIFMCNATDDPERERQHLDQLLGKRVDGLVVTSRRTDRRPAVGHRATGVPIIYVFSHADDPNALSLVPDDEGGARLAVAHLAEQGRHRIAHVTGPERFEAVRLRHRGYLEALAAAGLPQHEGFYLPGSWSESWGREAVDLLFSRGSVPDAIFCGNDQIARGAADALRDKGLGVPRDVAIVGFDNWDVMTLSSRPPLSSVDMNLHAMGREAGRYLLGKISGDRDSGIHRLPCTLVVRESSAEPAVAAVEQSRVNAEQ